jgi:hypothetical protein
MRMMTHGWKRGIGTWWQRNGTSADSCLILLAARSCFACLSQKSCNLAGDFRTEDIRLAVPSTKHGLHLLPLNRAHQLIGIEKSGSQVRAKIADIWASDILDDRVHDEELVKLPIGM